MKNILLIIFAILLFENLSGQNIPHANYIGPWGVQVNTFNGNLYLQRSDLTIPNQGLAIDFGFSYNSFRDTIDLGFGKGWSGNYHMRYDSISTDSMIVEYADGRRDIFVKNGDNYISPTGTFDLWEKYDSDNFRLTNKYGLQYYFDNAGHQFVTRIEDPNGKTITLGYNSADELITVTDFSGRVVNLIWSGGHLQTITDDNFLDSRNIEFSYNGDLLANVTDPEGGSITYGYDNGFLNFIRNEEGDEMHIKYNQKEKVSEIITCISHITFTYNPDQRKTYVAQNNNSGDRITTYHYDEEGKLIQKTGNCCGYNTQYQYDNDKNISTLTDANGNQFTANHDGMGNALLSADANGASQSFAFESTFNRLINLTDKRGNTTSMEYDANGNLERIIQQEGIETIFGYTTTGNINLVTDGNGETTNLIYNSNNDITTIAYPIGNETFTYDAVGNLETSTDGNGSSLAYSYDKLNRLQSITDNLNNTVSYEYDFASNLEKETDANGNEKSYTYDAHHRLQSVSTPAGNTLYEYDASDNLTGILDANQHTTTFQYDQRDLLIAEKDPLQNTTSYNYDGNGNVLSRTDANNLVTNYNYDPLNRLISKTYDGNTDSYAYDANGNLIFCANNHISMNFSYDKLNRMTSKTINNWNITISYGYDFAGNRTSMTDPDGTTHYEYDANHRLVKITNPAGEMTIFAYDDAGRLLRRDYHNNTFSEYTYDVVNRLLSLVHKNNSGEVLTSYQYTYDNNGNRLSMTTLEGTANYTYDGDNRLTDVNYNGILATDEAYTFDGTGNRTSFNTTPYTYDEADRLQTAGSTIYDFDNNGNLILKEENGLVTRYEYDGENRLVKVVIPSGEKVYFQYDPFGNRISQENPDGTTRYLLDGDNVLMELDNSGNTLARYTSGLALDSWISMERGGQSYVYHIDGVGSVAAITNDAQEIVNQYEYDAYGNIASQTGNLQNPYTYTGREWDESIGLYYYRMRFYDAAVGRFLTKDGFPGFITRPLSLNKYNYVEGNPVNNIDPQGKFFVNLVGGLISGIIAAAPDIDEHGTNFKCYDWIKIGTDVGMGLLPIGGIFKGLSLFGKAKKIEKTLPIIRKQRAIQNKIRKDVPALRNRYTNDAKLLGDISRLKFEAGGQIAGGLIGLKGNIDGLVDYAKYKIDGSNPCNTSRRGSQAEGPIGPPPPLPELPPLPGGNTVCIPIVRSIDPNEIIAPDGCGLENWVTQNATLPYTILYENDPDFATAPAQTVMIEHTFDNDINPFSFRLGDFGFGNYYFTVPDNLSFYNTQIDLTDSLGVLLDVVAGIDINNNKAFWIFESKDPLTGFPATLAADVGYLPVNDSLTHAGEGFVNFSVRAGEDSVTGDTIHAQASIIFDDNPAIQTNTAFNLIDADAPASEITVVSSAGNQYELSWAATDIGSGTSIYNLFASTDSTVFLPIANNLTDTTYTFIGQTDSTYHFLTVAIDCAGNVEPLKDLAPCSLVLADTTLIHPTNNAANGSIAIDIAGASGELYYQWSPDISTDSVATGLIAGIYTVTVTDELGCSVSLEIDLNDVIISTNESKIPTGLFILRLFPVPAQSEINIEFTSPDKLVWLEVFDASGKQVFAKTIPAEPEKINQQKLAISNWSAGNYIVHLHTKTERVSGLFVKQ